MNLKGAVCIVTGGARGIGKGYATGMLERGANVVIADLLVDVGKQTEAEFNTKYGSKRALFVQGDVTSHEDMTRLLDTTWETFGGLDVLVNNAGVGVIPSMARTFEINCFAAFRLSEMAQERMRKDKGGRGGVIINISSIAGLVTKAGGPVYHSTKHAVTGFTGALGKMCLADPKQGLRVVALCPGFVRTDLTKGAQEAYDKGDPTTVNMLNISGGWTDMADVVAGCIRIIETDIPSGSLLKAVASGLYLMYPENMPETKI